MRNHHRRFDRYYTYDKFTVESSQKLVASSKYMNFNVREKSKHTYCIVSFFILHNIYRFYTVQKRPVAVVKGCVILINNVALYNASKNVTLFHCGIDCLSSSVNRGEVVNQILFFSISCLKIVVVPTGFLYKIFGKKRGCFNCFFWMWYVVPFLSPLKSILLWMKLGCPKGVVIGFY